VYDETFQKNRNFSAGIFAFATPQRNRNLLFLNKETRVEVINDAFLSQASSYKNFVLLSNINL